MDSKSDVPCSYSTDASGRRYSSQQEREAALRADILETCRKWYAYDREQANRAFDWYAELLPWLKLERKK
jgi:hypothetical protein